MDTPIRSITYWDLAASGFSPCLNTCTSSSSACYLNLEYAAEDVVKAVLYSVSAESLQIWQYVWEMQHLLHLYSDG